jgi:glycosyltransferase involved in cell wall biosynthesis
MKKRVLMVLTRDIPRTTSNGRERTLRFIRDAIGADAELRELKIRSVFETGTLVSKLRAGLRVIGGVLSGKPCALQVAIFAGGDGKKQIVDAIENFRPDVVYFDGIRMVDYVAFVRRRFPESRIVSDLDDLMSRRAGILRAADFPLSAGYLAKSIPKPAIALINSRIIRSLLLRYEEYALKGHERLTATCSDAVTLVSATDADALMWMLPDPLKKRVHVIAPPIDSVKVVGRPSNPVRFVFIGADSQLQNRLAIRYLVASWKRLELRVPLVIYGGMTCQYESVPNVTFAGFAPTLADVYTPNSIALCPTFLRGGIKSKVLEAISFGCVPVGNEAAYEGLNFTDKALAMTDLRLERFLADPHGDLDEVLTAASRFAAYCERNFSLPVFTRRWNDLLRPSLYALKTEADITSGDSNVRAISLDAAQRTTEVQQHH